MKNTVISERYSHAIFELAVRQEAVRKTGGELNLVLQVIDGNPKLTQFLDNPRVPRENKVDVLKKVFNGRLSVLTINFLLHMLRKNRWMYFVDIVRLYQVLLDRFEGRKKARIETAVPISKDIREEVKKRLSALLGKEVELIAVVNPAVIGGAAVYINGIVIDGSLQAGLKSLKERLFTLRVH